MRRIEPPDPSDDAPLPRRRPPGNLPLESDAFVGRGDELAELAALLDTGRLVTVTGTGGVGKSRLAARAAALSAPRDGAWLVDLAAVRDADLVDYAVVEALRLTDGMTHPPRRVLLDQLAGRRLLLVLDGFEHLVGACASLVGELLRSAPDMKVLAVGRRPLSVGGERVLALAPLPQADALELLAGRAARPGLTLDGPLREDAAELCRRLDGIPLAVELAAGHLRTLSPRLLLDRLDDRFGLLTGGGRDRLPRHRTLRTTVGWSHELCTPQERLLWSRLSVFTGSFDLDAAEYICGGEGLHADAVAGVLDELRAQSVVVREETPAGVRFRMLDTVREYGAGWLTASGESTRLRRRHRDWCTGLATWGELDWFSPRQEEVAARIDAELPNLRSALDYCLSEPGEEHFGLHLAGTLWFYWVGCGRLAEGRHWLERCGAPAHRPCGPLPSGPHEESRLKVLWVLGYVAILQGDTVAARQVLDECRREAECSGNATALAYAEHRTGCLALIADDLPRAEELLRSALDRYRAIGELNSNVLMGRVELAMALAFRGDPGAAEEECRAVQKVCTEHGERWTLAYAQYVLAHAAWSEGDTVRARRLLEECLATDHAFHDLLGSVLALELLALVTLSEGDAAEAALLQGAAARIWPSIGLPLFGSRTYGRPRALCETGARERLGAVRYAELLGAGARLDTEEAVQRALGRGASAAAELAGTPADPEPPAQRKPAASPTSRGGETTG